MLAILRHSGCIPPEQTGTVVDVGCSRGFFIEPLTAYFSRVVGLDIDSNALRIARQENPNSEVAYLRADSLRLPLADGSVDLVLCNHVYEHVPDASALFAEILRVLKDNGACYLGAASRLIVMEPHYHLPFLSWLPKRLAHWYMRLSGRGSHYYENLRTYWGIKDLIREFDILDYTLSVLSRPDEFSARDVVPKGRLLDRVPLWIWRRLYAFLPTYLLILRKKVP
jgi:ubiquinone/menaquinone biosynthesis C-methylase UbiE